MKSWIAFLNKCNQWNEENQEEEDLFSEVRSDEKISKKDIPKTNQGNQKRT